MEPQSTQQMTPDEAAASLAFATNISEGMMPQIGPTMAPEESELALEGGETEETMKEPEENIDAKFEAFKEEINKMMDEKIGELKTMITESLKDEEE